MHVIDALDSEHIAEIAGEKQIPDFQAGDTVKVNVRVKEGSRERIQAYEGVCIARAGSGLNANFTVRKISYGEGVERVFPIHSPLVDKIEIMRRGRVRRSKLYYLRGRTGKAARIAERRTLRKNVERKNAPKQDEQTPTEKDTAQNEQA